MRPLGFSTGSLAHSNFRGALEMLQRSRTKCVELSALRFHELGPLIEALDTLDLSHYSHVSVHAPGAYPADHEQFVVDSLRCAAMKGWPIVLHPDAVFDFSQWADLGEHLLIENMDKRKPIGRTAAELSTLFEALPLAGLCFDIAHARQVDPSMAEAYRILSVHGGRIRQIHISEVTTSSSHGRISYAAMLDYQEVATYIPRDVPAILETPVSPAEFDVELTRAASALDATAHSHLHWNAPRPGNSRA